jgi:hypothetical protein
MSDNPRFELFAYWRTSATYRVRVALTLKGIEAEERFVDIDAGEHRSEAFLRINPLGARPIRRCRFCRQPRMAGPGSAHWRRCWRPIRIL